MISNMIKVLLFILVACFYSCSDDTNDNGTNENLVLDISQITPTDASGQLIGGADASDWTLNEIWPIEIIELFSGIENVNQLCTPPTELKIFPAYPNPNSGIFSLSIQKPDGITVDIHIVDSLANTLKSIDNIDANAVTFNAEEFTTSNDTFVRLYYLMSSDDNCKFTGHGDIKIK